MDSGAAWIGRTVEVVIESPAGSFVKRRPDGAVDMISPVPVPYNYGYVLGHTGGDGDPLDALVIGPRLPVGARGSYVVRGVVHFVDAGLVDDKLVCGHDGPLQRAGVHLFFAAYTAAKRLRYRLRGTAGATYVRSVDWGGPPVRGRTDP